MNCEPVILGSWPIILPVFAVGFVCGAVWMRARYRYMMDRYVTLMRSTQRLAQKRGCDGRC